MKKHAVRRNRKKNQPLFDDAELGLDALFDDDDALLAGLEAMDAELMRRRNCNRSMI